MSLQLITVVQGHCRVLGDFGVVQGHCRVRRVLRIIPIQPELI